MGLFIAKLSSGDEVEDPRKFKLHKKPPTKTINGERYDVNQRCEFNHPSFRKQYYHQERKFSSYGTDQTPSWDSSSGSKDEMKITLTVQMKSPLNNDRGLIIVYDSGGNLIFQIKHFEIWLMVMDAAGEDVFSIHRTRQGEGTYFYEGVRGSIRSRSCLSSKRGSFRVHNSCLPGQGSQMWEAIYEHNHYRLLPFTVDDSSDAELEFQIINAKGKIIAELKQIRHVNGWEEQLDEELLDLEVDPEADVSFVVAIVALFGLINHII